jgi:hypothetical protein
VEAGHKKRPLKKRSADINQSLMPKRRHPAVYAGIAFAILGGLALVWLWDRQRFHRFPLH